MPRRVPLLALGWVAIALFVGTLAFSTGDRLAPRIEGSTLSLASPASVASDGGTPARAAIDVPAQVAAQAAIETYVPAPSKVAGPRLLVLLAVVAAFAAFAVRLRAAWLEHDRALTRWPAPALRVAEPRAPPTTTR